MLNCLFNISFHIVLFLLENGLNQCFYFFYHDFIEAFVLLEVRQPHRNLVKGIKVDDPMKMLEDEADDITKGGKFGFLG